MNEPIVYADLTFLINFIIDFCILWTAAKLATIKISYTKLFLASVLGGFYAVGYLFVELAVWYSLPMKLIFSFLLVGLGLWPHSWNKFKLALLYFYGISFFVAGATLATSLLFATNQYYFTFSYICLLAGIFGALLIGVYGEKYLMQELIPKILKYQVCLQFAELSCSGQGFLDTGNGLRDPMSNKPILVAEYNLLKPCLPDDLNEAMDTSLSEDEMLEKLSYSSWANRLRLIPFSSIGKKNGLLIGIRADEVVVNIGSKKKLHKNIIIGVYIDKLSSEGSYQMLIPSEMVK
ncbi:MAG TPA: sigma-E processing peptidase SpoIIGA [Syntrophomonadaceae bacterium]|nr:sigma-E processing peptidase SpoIIGA [Syntrophomonadaceae bacterium]